MKHESFVMFIQCVFVASFMFKIQQCRSQYECRVSKGTYVTLWMHEHFAVYKNKSKPKGKRELDIYQAMEFRTGGDMPVNCRVGLSEKELAQIWVKGIYYAPAARIRRARPDLRRDRYIFQKDTALDWEPAVQYRAEMGDCPELVMVNNCTMWHPMSDVLHMLPRVVHPAERLRQ